MLEDINSYKMSYLIPLDQGGSNDPTNLKLICPTCYNFRTDRKSRMDCNLKLI